MNLVAGLPMGIYEDQQIHAKTGSPPTRFIQISTAGPAHLLNQSISSAVNHFYTDFSENQPKEALTSLVIFELIRTVIHCDMITVMQVSISSKTIPN